MTPENFAYWLQGFFELTKSNSLTSSQVQEIKNHLGLVLDKVTPEDPVEESKRVSIWDRPKVATKSPLDGTKGIFESMTPEEYEEFKKTNAEKLEEQLKKVAEDINKKPKYRRDVHPRAHPCRCNTRIC